MMAMMTSNESRRWNITLFGRHVLTTSNTFIAGLNVARLTRKHGACSVHVFDLNTADIDCYGNGCDDRNEDEAIFFEECFWIK